MKVHYINILLFAIPLNILIYNQRNHKSTTHHTLKIPITRLLCECELYSPVNYDNDPQMKEVMENFNKQTQQRFEEYDERMKTTRQKCKEQCDKEIQKIILKDKLEKELMDKFATLHTDVQSDAIPTCICEKSVSEKVEKGCLECGGILGAAMPELGSIGGSLLYALSKWQTTEIATAIAAAQKAGIDAATQAGMNAVRLKIKEWYVYFSTEKIVDFTSVVKESNFSSASALHESAMNLLNNYCNFNGNLRRGYFCSTIKYGDKTTFPPFAQAGTEAYNATLPTKTAAFETKYIDGVNTAYGGYQTAIIASIVAIVVIVLIMVIIYLILRYRRKKKMKKKLQYIKLLEE
ncbi:rifin [Plasmodium falciparum NF54]|uniref:Rifin n=2 Tax=Plasmodium falciparum TaxID=5833 RepID=Q8IEV0_PLAF7|nr:rifin [Plasmodium falciparum 3D7]KAF4329757.1 rifin [Plasmodium falciparum NF54]PKC47217.1 rifin [Plasmodium falciparum NF54]CAD52144.1 rifin [Plasmodium falciparum 3D7]|eukprot:XP_001349739.1 rifin [Plasmodium falciparum 3D7]